VLSPQRTKLWDKLQPAIAQPHANTRELGKPNADMIAVRHDGVAEVFEIGAKRGQLGNERRGLELPFGRHVSKLRALCPQRHAAGAAHSGCEEYMERAVALAYQKEGSMPFAIESSVFQQGGAIPRRFTCDAEDASPPLRWSGAPEKTRSFALIVDDPDAPDPAAPKRVYVHWVLYDMPASVTSIDTTATSSSSTHSTRRWAISAPRRSAMSRTP
jgi:hypothetical protein